MRKSLVVVLLALASLIVSDLALVPTADACRRSNGCCKPACCPQASCCRPRRNCCPKTTCCPTNAYLGGSAVMGGAAGCGGGGTIVDDQSYQADGVEDVQSPITEDAEAADAVPASPALEDSGQVAPPLGPGPLAPGEYVVEDVRVEGGAVVTTDAVPSEAGTPTTAVSTQEGAVIYDSISSPSDTSDVPAKEAVPSSPAEDAPSEDKEA